MQINTLQALTNVIHSRFKIFVVQTQNGFFVKRTQSLQQTQQSTREAANSDHNKNQEVHTERTHLEILIKISMESGSKDVGNKSQCAFQHMFTQQFDPIEAQENQIKVKFFFLNSMVVVCDEFSIIHFN